MGLLGTRAAGRATFSVLNAAARTVERTRGRAGVLPIEEGHPAALDTVARSVELDSSQKRERSWWRKATLPLSTRPLELLSGLETEQGPCQSREGPLHAGFPYKEQDLRGE